MAVFMKNYFAHARKFNVKCVLSWITSLMPLFSSDRPEAPSPW